MIEWVGKFFGFDSLTITQQWELTKIILEKGFLVFSVGFGACLFAIIMERYKSNLKIFEAETAYRTQLVPQLVPRIDKFFDDISDVALRIREKRSAIQEWTAKLRKVAELNKSVIDRSMLALKPVDDVLLEYVDGEETFAITMLKVAPSDAIARLLIGRVWEEHGFISAIFRPPSPAQLFFEDDMLALATHQACIQFPDFFRNERDEIALKIKEVAQDLFMLSSSKNSRYKNNISTILGLFDNYIVSGGFHVEVIPPNFRNLEAFRDVKAWSIEEFLIDLRGAMLDQASNMLYRG